MLNGNRAKKLGQRCKETSMGEWNKTKDIKRKHGETILVCMVISIFDYKGKKFVERFSVWVDSDVPWRHAH